MFDMIESEKPDSIMVTIRNRRTPESKSFTVYNTTVNEVYDVLTKFLKAQKKG